MFMKVFPWLSEGGRRARRQFDTNALLVRRIICIGRDLKQNCGKRARCIASIPAMEKLLGEARAARVTVVYSLIHDSRTADVIKDVAPNVDEPSVMSGPDKFLDTELEKILKDKGIKTVIVTGTAANARCCSPPRARHCGA